MAARWFRAMVDNSVYLRLAVALRARCVCFRRFHIARTDIALLALCLRRPDSQLLPEALVPLAGLDLRDLTTQLIKLPLFLLNLSYSILTVPCVKPLHKPRYQVRMLGCFVHSGQLRAGRFALPRAVESSIFMVTQFTLEILLYLLLEQAKVQIAESVRTEPSAVVGRVVLNIRDRLELVRDARKGCWIDTARSESLEEQERF